MLLAAELTDGASLKKIAENIPGYSYGAAEVARSAVSVQDLERLKVSAGFTDEDQRFLRLAGEVLAKQTEKIVAHWRGGIIAGIPHLARHSRSIEGEPLPEYLAKSNLRFEQWILDTCFRAYDPRLDQLSAGNRVAAHVSEEKPSGRGAVDGFRAVARHRCIYRGNQREHQAVSGGGGPWR